jgi:hypothetical protein
MNEMPSGGSVLRASRQTLHNARRGYLRILYPYHPYFGQTFEVLGAAGGLRDLVYVRMPNNATRGIPAWMFDETICARVRCADRPLIDCQALLRLAQLLELHRQSRGTGGHEPSLAPSEIASRALPSPDEPDAGGVAPKRSPAQRGSKPGGGFNRRATPLHRPQASPFRRRRR